MMGIGSVGTTCAVDTGAEVVDGTETIVWVGAGVDNGAHALRKSSPIERCRCH